MNKEKKFERSLIFMKCEASPMFIFNILMKFGWNANFLYLTYYCNRFLNLQHVSL